MPFSQMGEGRGVVYCVYLFECIVKPNQFVECMGRSLQEQYLKFEILLLQSKMFETKIVARNNACLAIFYHCAMTNKFALLMVGYQGSRIVELLQHFCQMTHNQYYC